MNFDFNLITLYSHFYKTILQTLADLPDFGGDGAIVGVDYHRFRLRSVVCHPCLRGQIRRGGVGEIFFQSRNQAGMSDEPGRGFGAGKKVIRA